MCGISGLLLPPEARVDDALVRELLECLIHRGPDDRGWLSLWEGEVRCGRALETASGGQAVLVNHRLAIVDLSEDGWQPMSSLDGRYHITYNGELYNYVELRRELEELGCKFRSRSDTEVLLMAVARWGPACLSRFVGMYAFAMLDVRERKVLLARDCFGIKPLYYASWGGGLAFGSEMKVLMNLPGLPREINPQRLHQYLRFGLTDHDQQTMLSSIRQLPPAHYLEVSLDNPGAPPQPQRYWAIEPERSDFSFEEAASRLRDLFLESVRLHLRSDVPVGAAFSGGIDSSSLVTSMRHLLGSKLELHAFSYVAEGESISEESWIDLVGASSGVTVHKVRAKPQELMADIDRLIVAQDEPFRSTSIYAQYRVFQLAHECGIKVTLDGQGADEILAGYRPYVAARLASCFRQARLREGIALARSSRRLPDTQPVRLLYQAGGFILPRALHSAARKMVGADLVPRWLNGRWFSERGVNTQALGPPSGPHMLQAALQTSVDTTSLPALLRYEDRNSMAHSVESRVPFLTPELVQFCLSLPEEYLIARDGTSKAVFRKAMQGIVPTAVLERRDKVGFETPELHWLRALQAWVSQTISSASADRIPALERTVMKEEWEGILGGRKSFDSRVWRWCNLIRWAELLDVRLDT